MHSIPTDPEEYIEKNDGLLTTRDRKYLLGQKSYDNEQTERNVRQDIRDRVRMAFVDLLLLSWRLPDSDRRTIFEPISDIDPVEHVEHIRAKTLQDSPAVESALLKEFSYTDAFIRRDDVVSDLRTRKEILLQATIHAQSLLMSGLLNAGHDPAQLLKFSLLFTLRAKNARHDTDATDVFTDQELQVLDVLLRQEPLAVRREMRAYVGLDDYTDGDILPVNLSPMYDPTKQTALPINCPPVVTVLELLREGRCTPSYLSEVTGYTRKDITTQLACLIDDGCVRMVHPGLFEIVANPIAQMYVTMDFQRSD